jgi:hypothetical protein
MAVFPVQLVFLESYFPQMPKESVVRFTLPGVASELSGGLGRDVRRAPRGGGADGEDAGRVDGRRHRRRAG